MSAFNTPFQRGQGLSNQGIPSPSQFRPTPDSAVADAVGRAGVSIAQQAIRNQREEERQKQLEEQQEQRLAVRRATAEAQEAKAALGRQLAEGQIDHDAYFAESSSLLDNTKGVFEDLAKTYPDAQAEMDIASLEVANRLNNTTSGIRVKYLEDQAYQNAAEGIESLVEGVQVFRFDAATDQNVFLLEPTVERLELLREQIKSDTALSPRDKASLISSLEQQTVYTALNQLQASGKVDPSSVEQIKRMTDNEVLRSSIDKVVDDVIDIQEETRLAAAERDYQSMEREQFNQVQDRDVAPDYVALFRNMQDAAAGLDYELATPDLVQRIIRSAETRLVADGLGEKVAQGGVLNADEKGQLATLEAQIQALVDGTDYTKDKSGITLIEKIQSIRTTSKKNREESISLSSSTPEEQTFAAGEPGRAAAVADSIKDGTYLKRMIAQYNATGSTEPEYVNKLEELARQGNWTDIAYFADGLTRDRRQDFARTQGISTPAGFVMRVAIRSAEPGVESAKLAAILDNPLALARAYGAVAAVSGNIDAAEGLAETSAFYETEDGKPVARTTPPTEQQAFGQRFDFSVMGALSFEDINGDEVSLRLPGFEAIESYFMERVGINSAIIQEENPQLALAALRRQAFEAARQDVQNRYDFVRQQVTRMDDSFQPKTESVLIPYDKTVFPNNIKPALLIRHAQYVLDSEAERTKPGGEGTAVMDLDDIHKLDKDGDEILVVPFRDLQDNSVVGYFQINRENYGQYQPESWWAMFDTKTTFQANKKLRQGYQMTPKEYESKLGEGYEKKNLKTGEPISMRGMSYDPQLLWSEELYESTSVKRLHRSAQANLMSLAQSFVERQHPDVSPSTKMTLAIQTINDHGWSLT
tara:strand:+ start:7385 stop:10003 length:2619 start_codon:yes stop_codon:yes gene_type:complete